MKGKCTEVKELNMECFTDLNLVMELTHKKASKQIIHIIDDFILFYIKMYTILHCILSIHVFYVNILAGADLCLEQ